MIKIHPLQFPVVCKISVPPVMIERTFGKGFTANRNGKYALKEWDFVDSNCDRYLVYDYKATTDFWGLNLDPEEYEVEVNNSRD